MIIVYRFNPPNKYKRIYILINIAILLSIIVITALFYNRIEIFGIPMYQNCSFKIAFQVKYSPCGECEIIPLRKLWNIAPSSQCEMKFAHIREANISHLRSKYFTAKLFHLPARANFVEKSTHCLGRQMCAFFCERATKRIQK